MPFLETQFGWQDDPQFKLVRGVEKGRVVIRDHHQHRLSPLVERPVNFIEYIIPITTHCPLLASDFLKAEYLKMPSASLNSCDPYRGHIVAKAQHSRSDASTEHRCCIFTA
jgi:hypothetical protein